MDVRIEAEAAHLTVTHREASVTVSQPMPFIVSASFLPPNQELSLMVHVLNSPHGPPTFSNELHFVGAALA